MDIIHRTSSYILYFFMRHTYPLKLPQTVKPFINYMLTDEHRSDRNQNFHNANPIIIYMTIITRKPEISRSHNNLW